MIHGIDIAVCCLLPRDLGVRCGSGSGVGLGVEMSSSVHDDLVDPRGTPFGQRYELCGRLGDGMSSCVFVARDRTSDKRFALKLATRSAGRRVSWSHLQRTFHREHDLLRALDGGPHLVSVHERYEGANQMGLLLSLAPGGDCQQLLQRHGCLSEGAACSIARQVAEALRFVHSLDILHRDIKLENILVSCLEPPVATLCDFGHSCYVHELKQGDRFMGTPGYAAPEVTQRAGVPAWSPAADVWGVGVVLYALLANSPLRWEDGNLHLSSRSLLKVSAAVKALMQARILVASPAARASVGDVAEALAIGSHRASVATADGLRRATLGSHSFSLVGLSSLDTADAVPRAAAVRIGGVRSEHSTVRVLSANAAPAPAPPLHRHHPGTLPLEAPYPLARSPRLQMSASSASESETGLSSPQRGLRPSAEQWGSSRSLSGYVSSSEAMSTAACFLATKHSWRGAP